MAKTSRLQIRIAPETKERGEELFESLGLTMSSAVNLFIAKSLSVGGLPFNIGAPESLGSGEEKSNTQ